MIDPKNELENGLRYPIQNCSMVVNLGFALFSATPVDRNGFGIRFDTDFPFYVGEKAEYSLTDNETGDTASNLSVVVAFVEKLPDDLYRVGAIYDK